MKNVLLIGDSIRMGYDKALKKTLEGRACKISGEITKYLPKTR